MESTTTSSRNGWCPLTGQRIFKSVNQAWNIYGKYRFSVSARTFQTYVGKNKDCPPRDDGTYCVEDIEIFAQSRGWSPTPYFVRGALTGGEGESTDRVLNDIGAEIQKEKLLKARLEREDLEMDIAKKRKELLPRKEFEQMLAAAAAVVGNEAETFVYDHVREIIYLCSGKPEKEDSLREYLLERVKRWLHAFSRPGRWEVEFYDEGVEELEGDPSKDPAVGFPALGFADSSVPVQGEELGSGRTNATDHAD